MKNDKRVLSRQNARELSPEEVNSVSGGIRTLTVCTVPFAATTADGDPGEC